ncbi:MAG: AmmeMemoRadiSam system protein A [Candidatus Binatia bacterium]
MLGLARSAILSTLGGGAAPAPSPIGRLHEPGAAFVTLHRGGTLRGCIGNLAFERPLHEMVSEAAVAAAFDDPRFPPIEEDEYRSGVEVEVSVLSPLVASPRELIVAGWHGVCLSARGAKSVFLPQVAREERWSRRTLLEQLALKAGLEPAAWRDPDACFETFTSEIVSER